MEEEIKEEKVPEQNKLKFYPVNPVKIL